uniref:Laminin subunit alpha-5 n=1 Tax=Gopherus evgoodei TaxID=1825980 RepID=A0A8C4W263_9SAUR
MARGEMDADGLRGTLVSLLLLAAAALPGGAVRPRVPLPGDVNGYSLHPPYFNLAESTRISATATCGEERGGGGSRGPRAVEDLYCKLVGGPVAGGDPNQTIQGQYCDICTSMNSNKAHPITNAIDGTERWWQSPPLSRGLEFNQVNVTLDLGQVLFHVAYVLIKFANSPRPDLWVLERSTDFGLTYEPWQYFASSRRDCIEKFGPNTVKRITKDDDTICTTEYSRIVPLENGEIVVSLVNGRPGAMNFSYSPLLRNFTKATNIRLRFLQTNTLLGHLMGKALRDPTVTRRYYYSIKDISIGGRCVCHGHADVCDAKDPTDPYRLQCDCQHNTCGGSCDRCCPGFNQLPWKPATTDSANECQPCNCNGHAYDCYYDPEVDRHKASKNYDNQYKGGGVCIECQHHTTGINCERCIPGYYKSPDHSIDSPYICYRCNCDSEFTDGTCEDLTGRCYCKPNYTGELCNACAEGYTDFPHCYPVPAFSHNDTGEQVLPAGQIINCDCNAAGTEGNACRKDSQRGMCVCKPNFQGAQCDQCAPGHYGPGCQPCQCSGPGQYDGTCDSETGQCLCRSGFEGYSCNQCAPGYFSYPLCQLCGCSAVGTLPGGCDSGGRCFCRPEFDGPRCDQCSMGYHSYPRCQACSCDPRGSVDNNCSPAGQCRCHSNYAGHTCSQCAPGFYGYPSCTSCQCSTEGSLHGTCDQETGQCSCRPKVAGLRCDTCMPGAYGFPHCEVGSCNPAGLATADPSLSPGSCACRAYVEGPACDRCKPLYWNLTPDNPYGCTSCQCDTKGTISGVAECQQGNGQCFCKPSICGQLCSTCKDGYFNLDHANYFGCQGCRCDVGGSIGPACEARTGACHCSCHHRAGTTLDGRAVRFGYNPLEFENFSWRGYAQMSPIQPKVVVTLNVTSPDLFRIVFRYVNRGPANVEGRVSVLEEGKFNVCGNCTEQTKQIIFAPSTEPAFVTVPQNSFGEPFVLNPSVWSLIVEAEGILLDYLVLLPSSYYEAPILQLKVTEACTYSPRALHCCLLYKYLSVDSFPSASGGDMVCRLDNSLPRPCPMVPITPSHPQMALCSGSDVEVQLRLVVPQPGRYVLLVEYANKDAMQRASVAISSLQLATQQGSLTFHTCDYSFLCRGIVLDSQNRLAAFELTTEGTIRFAADQAHFFLYKVYLIPYGQFTMEFVEPKVHCISLHGTFSPSSSSCIPSRFMKLSQSIVLEAGQALSIPPDFPLTHVFTVAPTGIPTEPLPRPPTAVDSSAELILLQPSQAAAVFNSRIQTLGRYAFIMHYYQPNHPTFPVEVLINGGRIWQGQAKAAFCPHGYGCRSVVVSENQVILDVTDNELTVIVRVPAGRQLWLDYILVVPEDSYSSHYLLEEPLDKSYEFISSCGVNSFYINPTTSSKFCRDSAISLSLFYNNGAQPCRCHEAGAIGGQCELFGGQCACKSNIIGRECSRCATGYWGFPNCRPCDCGTRLCDEVTGQCICPPHTIKPECVVCEPQTFGCHALIGCEDCNCSRTGVQELAEPGCDMDSGQCRCKPNIIGRRCDVCAPGYYHYPHCRRCYCHQAGTEVSVCDPVTGQCHCKENVEGVRCDQCRLGTFSLDANNPKGCTRCFCFGATDRCHSAEKYRVEFINMNGWVLLSGDRQEVATSLRLEEQLIHADLKNVPEAYQELYWHAPSSYLGDRVSSYGGYLRYELRSDTRRGDVFIPMEPRPDVILKGNQMSIMFLEGTSPSPGEVHEGRLQLMEGNFRHTQTHNPVSREELMMVLANLEQLQIRALFSQLASSVYLRQVVLETVTEISGGIRASNVELCMCPANYRGDSCQECAPGYYRDTKGLFLGKCVPCHCNGHSDQCLPGSGICINCQHNTEGDRCERCKDGYVGNFSLDGPLQCMGCPCPLSVASNNFAVGCVHKGSTMQCLCKPGYAGAMCERCAPGYYGNPLVIGSSCQPCDCSENTDPNMLFSDCDSLTGACTGCMYNTAGPRCEVCAPGYHGDAVVAKNCTRCNCLPCGTELCDPRTGRCLCKPGVTGQHCDCCQDGYYGYRDCSGCRKCDCDIGSIGTSCHAETGQCSCQPGVTGLRCQQCAPGYWGLSKHGCTKCRCKGGSCDPRSGECTCSNGLTGKQCDTCIEKYEIPVANGPDSMRCEVCDSCVLLLLDDLQKIKASFPIIKNQLINLNASSIAWARLHGLNSSVKNVTVCGGLNVFSPLMDKLGTADLSTASSEEFWQKMAEVQRMLKEMKERDFLSQKGVAEHEHEKAQKLLHRVRSELYSKWESNQDLVKSIKDMLSQYSSELMDLRDALNEAVNKTRQTEDLNSLNRNNLEESQKQYGVVQDTLQMAEDSLVQVSDLLQIIENAKEVSDEKAQGCPVDSGSRCVRWATALSNLESTIPLLLEKLSGLENRRNKNSTVSENILRIRQLITQARNAASKVKVPVKFNGTSGIQVRTPSDLQDLSAYTSLKFYIQNPEPKPRQRRQDGADAGQFILYLGNKDATGDYMGIVLKDRKVQWIYKLGDEEPTYLTVDEEIGEQFAAVSINRILQYGHMSVIVEKQTLHETKGDSVAKGEQGLLNLEPHSVVFYVGGYPTGFMPPVTLRYPSYRGCIEMDTLNEEVVSLYNFQRTFHLDTASDKPCARSKSTGDPWLTDGSYFDGTGYAEIKFESQIGSTKRFEQEIRVVSYNGILFFLEHQFLCLAVQDGKLVLYYDFKQVLEMAPPSSDPTSLTVSSTTNKAIQIFLLTMSSKQRILVRLERQTIFMVEHENSLENAVSYYLGGVPMPLLPKSLKAIFPKGGSIRGCMKGLKALGKYVDLKRMNTVGVSYGCTSDLLVARSVKFHGHGYLTLPLKNVPSLQDFYTGFSFRTSQSHGLLYSHTTTEGNCQVSLKNGRVAVTVLKTELTTKHAYADDASHYVAIYSDATGVRLYIDDQLQGPKQGADRYKRHRRQEEQMLFRLGGLPEAGALSNLTGCIGNVFVNWGENCDTEQPLLFCRSHFSLDVRLNSPSGLLFYVASELQGSFMALFVSSGRFVFLADLNGKKLRVRSKDKYHDGRWHTVSRGTAGLVLGRAKSLQPIYWSHAFPAHVLCQQVMDQACECLPTLALSLSLQDTSVPSFSGCLKNLKLDGKALDSPSRVFGVTPCYEGMLESGIFFAAEGGYVTLAWTFTLGGTHSLLFQHMKANAGAGEFSTSVARPSLCDGQWHSIKQVSRVPQLALTNPLLLWAVSECCSEALWLWFSEGLRTGTRCPGSSAPFSTVLSGQKSSACRVDMRS